MCFYLSLFLLQCVFGQRCLIDLGVVLDSSDAVTSSEWDFTTQFVADVGNAVNLGQNATRVGVVSQGVEKVKTHLPIYRHTHILF